MARSHYSMITTSKDKMSVKSSNSMAEKDPSHDFHSTLFKESHAPKEGWRTIDAVPMKYIAMPNIEKAIKKLGKFTFKNTITKVEAVSLPPVTN